MLEAKRRFDAKCVEGKKEPEGVDELEGRERGTRLGKGRKRRRGQLRTSRFHKEDEERCGGGMGRRGRDGFTS